MNSTEPTRTDPRPKRIAIVVELDQPYPWHHACYQGILEYAEAHRWDCVVDPHLVGLSGRIDMAGYDGVVGRINHRIADAARQYRVPVVNHWMNSPAKDLARVFQDHVLGTQLAVNHLVARGFRSFGHVGYTRDRLDREDVQQMAKSLAAHGFEHPRSIFVRRSFETEPKRFARFRDKLTRWLDAIDKPVGLLVSSSVVGRYLAQFCREMGLRVPHDLAIVLQTGDVTVDTSVKPTLSSIDHDYFRIGYVSASLLDQLMRGEPADDTPVLVRPRQLLIRESSDTFVISDPLASSAMRYIADHAASPLTVSEVADAVSVSRRTLERAFEQHLGRTVYSEITRFRADFIKRVLVDSREPLAAVAVECGFASVSHFTEFFRKATGDTPSRYRKQQQRR